MSCGDLFYSQPGEYTESKAAEELEQLAEELSLSLADTKLKKRLEREVRAIKTSGNALRVLIIHEIAQLSNELGYPIALNGNEGGLYIMELLGISNIRTDDYENSGNLSELCVDEMLDGKVDFELSIAELVRKHIQNRLNYRFVSQDCSKELFCRICMPGCDWLKQIGESAKKTGVFYNSIEYSSPELMEKLFNSICREKNIKEITPPEIYTPLETARLFAFSVTNHKEGVRFSDVRQCIFREDFYKEFRNKDIQTNLALWLSRNWSEGKKKEADVALLKSYGVSEDIIGCYEKLSNTSWSAASCLSRLNTRAMLLYYDILNENSN